MEDFLIWSYCVPLAVVGPGEVTLLKTLWDPWEMAGPGPSPGELSFAPQTLLGRTTGPKALSVLCRFPQLLGRTGPTGGSGGGFR